MEGLETMLRKYKSIKQFPMGVVGEPYRELRSSSELPIRRVTNNEELRDLIAQYTGIKSLETPLLVEDLAFLSPWGLQSLLKFVEDTRLDVILLSTYDNFTPPLLSRLKVFIKAPIERTNSNFLDAGRGRDRIDSILSGDSHVLDRVRYQGRESPILYYNEKNVPRRPNRSKFLSLIE